MDGRPEHLLLFRLFGSLQRCAARRHAISLTGTLPRSPFYTFCLPCYGSTPASAPALPSRIPFAKAPHLATARRLLPAFFAPRHQHACFYADDGYRSRLPHARTRYALLFSRTLTLPAWHAAPRLYVIPLTRLYPLTLPRTRWVHAALHLPARASRTHSPARLPLTASTFLFAALPTYHTHHTDNAAEQVCVRAFRSIVMDRTNAPYGSLTVWPITTFLQPPPAYGSHDHRTHTHATRAPRTAHCAAPLPKLP